MNLSLKKETSNRATLLNIKEASLWASKYLNKKVKKKQQIFPILNLVSKNIIKAKITKKLLQITTKP